MNLPPEAFSMKAAQRTSSQRAVRRRLAADTKEEPGYKGHSLMDPKFSKRRIQSRTCTTTSSGASLMEGNNLSSQGTRRATPAGPVMIAHHHHHGRYIWPAIVCILTLGLAQALAGAQLQPEATAKDTPMRTTGDLISSSGSKAAPTVGPLNGTTSTLGGGQSAAQAANATATTLRGNQTKSLANASTAANSSTVDPATLANSNSDDGDRLLIIAVISANIIIFIIGFIGNSVVILVILKFTKIETVTDIYILNLAVADLMFITGLIFLITTMFISHWIFGNLMCKLYMATTSLNQFASSLLLVVMSFDRYLAVCHPIYAQRFRRIKRAKIICFCIWIVCLVLMAPIFAFAKISNDLTCAIFWPDYKNFNCEVAFTMYSFAIGFAFPLLLIAAFYLCVIRKLRIAAQRGPQLGSARRSKSRVSTNRRIEHLVIGIICTYTICWLPYWITQLCVSFITNNRQPVAGFYGIVLTASSLSYTNSALNPILYAFLSDNFKRRCSDILRSIYSFKLFQNCCLGFIRISNANSASSGANNKASHSYLAPAPTTTGCCETEITRPDPRSNHLYLNEFNQQPQQQLTSLHNNNNHAKNLSSASMVTSTTTSRPTIVSQPPKGSNGPEELEAGNQRQQLEHGDDTDETGSGSVGAICGLGSLDNAQRRNNHRQTRDKQKRDVNFVVGCSSSSLSKNAKAVIGGGGDNNSSRNYHTKIHHDRTQCQGV